MTDRGPGELEPPDGDRRHWCWVMSEPTSPNGRTAADILKQAGADEALAALPAYEQTPVVVRVGDVAPERVRWLWPTRIPLGKLTVLDGDPALGKSTLMVDITARVTTGAPWPDAPDNEQREPSAVVWMTAEDGIADTLRPRLEAAGADAARVVVLDGIQVLDDDGNPEIRPPVLPGDANHLGAVVTDTGATLVVVDVLAAYLDARVDFHRDQAVRGALAQLARLAEQVGCAIVVLRHLNKTVGGNPLYRGGGSIGIIGQARAGMLVATDPGDETGVRRILAPTKSNLAALPTSLAYRLVTDDEWDCGRVHWEGTTAHQAADLLAAPGAVEDGGDAAAVLAQVLAEGPLWAKQAFDAMAEAGFSRDQTKRAKVRLKVRTSKVGKPGDADQGWQWTLPPAATERDGQTERRERDTPEECEGVGSLGAAPFAPFAPQPLPSETPASAEGDDR